jgi:hypothetical protein
MPVATDKLKLTGRNLGRVVIFRCVRACAPGISFTSPKLSSLKLKTRAKQLLGSLQLAFALPTVALRGYKDLKHGQT